MDRVGFFGGSFDPIHLGHINLAIELLERQNLNKIIFCPARCSPHKLSAPPITPLSQRIEMVERAIEGNPNFILTAIEEEGIGPSYTIDTIKAFQKKNTECSDSTFFLILAEDALARFYLWKDVHALCHIASPLFGRRTLRNPDLSDYPDPSMISLLKKGLIDMPMFEISSSNIRFRLKNNLYCKHLLPRDVLDFIDANKLYL